MGAVLGGKTLRSPRFLLSLGAAKHLQVWDRNKRLVIITPDHGCLKPAGSLDVELRVVPTSNSL